MFVWIFALLVAYPAIALFGYLVCCLKSKQTLTYFWILAVAVALNYAGLFADIPYFLLTPPISIVMILWFARETRPRQFGGG